MTAGRQSHISQALAHQDTHDLCSVLAAIGSGAAQAWCGTGSTIVTEILDYPLMRVCRIWLASGDMDELVADMLPQVEAWAASNGCRRVEIVGRRGWKRKLPDYCEAPQVVLHKEI